MLDITKTDEALGEKVSQFLTEHNLETPCLKTFTNENDKIDRIEPYVSVILNVLGFDLNDESLRDTPRRVAKMLVMEKFWGLEPKNFPKWMAIENKMGYDQMLIERDIPVISKCEHHLEDIIGKATVAYIPRRLVAGLSKINRVVEYYSRRPQVQERLTQQIQKTLEFLLGTENVACSITAAHNCIQCRGVSHLGTSTTTNCFGGVFLTDQSAREELLKFL